MATVGSISVPYFAAIEGIWADRSYHIAETIVEGLFPSALADERLRDAAQAWLAVHPDAAPALRRLIVESLAGVERALRAQEVDAAS